MATIKTFTDISQSKVLAEILPLESADMLYWKGEYITHSYMEGQHKDEQIPVWSLAALLNLLPSEFTEVGKYSTTKYVIKIRKYKHTDEVNLYQIAYGSYKWYEDGGYTWSDMINTGEKEDFLDAVFEMVCWLKKNNKI